VTGLNGGIGPCEGPGISDVWAHKVGQMFSALFFSVYQPLRSQYSPIFLSLDSTCHFEV